MSEDMMMRILTALGRLEAGQDQLRADFAQLRTDVAQIRTDVAQIHTDVAQIHTDVAQLRADHDHLRSAQTSLRDELIRTRTELMARMDRLQNVLTTAREGDVVNIGIAERAERIAKGTQEDLRSVTEQLSAMIRQIRNLQAQVDALHGDGSSHPSAA